MAPSNIGHKGRTSAVHSAALQVNALAGPVNEPPVPVPVPADLQQRALSATIDGGAVAQLTDPTQANLGLRAHMSLLQLEGAGTWLHTVPSEALGTKVTPQLYVPMLQRRLRMQIYDEPFFCPLCDGVMDVFADHALTCACGGDRTKRHNFVRNVGVRLATAAGWRPEPEKPHLLRARPTAGVRSEDGSEIRGSERGPEARRPADIYVVPVNQTSVIRHTKIASCEFIDFWSVFCFRI